MVAPGHRRLVASATLLACALSAGAARAQAGGSAAKPASAQPPEPPAVAQKRHERDDLRRQDLAMELAQMGLPLKWQAFALEQLTDWRDRLRAAQSLHILYGVDVDWRTLSLASLTDMRLRAAKASELSSLYGIRADWRRYSWVALEALRRQAARFPVAAGRQSAARADKLAQPGWAGTARHGFPFRSKDPDALMEPTFAFETTQVWSHPFGRRAKFDPDAILVPTFVSLPSPPIGPDDLIDPRGYRALFGR